MNVHQDIPTDSSLNNRPMGELHNQLSLAWRHQCPLLDSAGLFVLHTSAPNLIVSVIVCLLLVMLFLFLTAPWGISRTHDLFQFYPAFLQSKCTLWNVLKEKDAVPATRQVTALLGLWQVTVFQHLQHRKENSLLNVFAAVTAVLLTFDGCLQFHCLILECMSQEQRC